MEIKITIMVETQILYIGKFTKGSAKWCGKDKIHSLRRECCLLTIARDWTVVNLITVPEYVSLYVPYV